MKEMRHKRAQRPHSERMRKRAQDSEAVHVREGIPQDPGAIPAPAPQLYGVTPISFYTLDRAGRICELSENGAKFLGFSASWLLGKSFVVFIASEHVHRFLELLNGSLRGPESQVIELDMSVLHRTQPVQISLTTLKDGPSVLHRLTVVNLTDFRQAEQLLQESLANWYSLVHNAPETIMTVEKHGRISFVNRPIWGYSINALLDTNLLDHIPETDHLKLSRCLEQSFRFNKRSTCEITGVYGDWMRWFNFSFGSPHPVMGVGVGGLATTRTTTTLIIREISETKRTEETLRSSGEQLRGFAARLDAVREEERTRVAREIHDELGQALTILKLDLSWVQSKTQRAEIRKKMKGMIAHVDDTIERVRRISSELRPSILDDLGLIPAIEWQVSQFRKRTGIRTQIVSNADGLNLPTEAAAAVFRVVQEAFTNIIRHAMATRVSIRLESLQQALRISIVDNGRGMTQTEETHLKSLGIVGMKERVSRLGGDLNIFSEPGRGTRIDIVIPTK